MKLQRKEVLDIYNVLSQLTTSKVAPRIAWGIAKNKAIGEEELNVLQEARKTTKTPEGIEDYEKERLELCESYAEVDDKGKSKKKNIRNENGQLVEIFDILPEKTEELNEKLKELKETKYKETFDQAQAIEDEFTFILEEELDLPLVKLNLDNLPEISAEQIKILEPILEVK